MVSVPCLPQHVSIMFPSCSIMFQSCCNHVSSMVHHVSINFPSCFHHVPIISHVSPAWCRTLVSNVFIMPAPCRTLGLWCQFRVYLSMFPSCFLLSFGSTHHLTQLGAMPAPRSSCTGSDLGSGSGSGSDKHCPKLYVGLRRYSGQGPRRS